MKKSFLLFSTVAFAVSCFFSSCEKKEDEGITVTYASEAGSGNNPNKREVKPGQEATQPKKESVKK